MRISVLRGAGAATLRPCASTRSTTSDDLMYYLPPCSPHEAAAAVVVFAGDGRRVVVRVIEPAGGDVAHPAVQCLDHCSLQCSDPVSTAMSRHHTQRQEPTPLVCSDVRHEAVDETPRLSHLHARMSRTGGGAGVEDNEVEAAAVHIPLFVVPVAKELRQLHVVYTY